MGRRIDIEEVRKFISEQPIESKIFIGGDSERVIIDNVWYADYTTAIVIHHNGNSGCKIFGDIVRERVYDQKLDKPRMRLMTEVMNVANLFLQLQDVLEGRDVEIHLDLNRNETHGSSCVVNEAVGYIRGMCNLTPQVKPNAWAASCVADRLKTIIKG